MPITLFSADTVDPVFYPLFTPFCAFVSCCLDVETRVILKSPEDEPGPDRYINANYIRVRVRPRFSY